MAAVRKPGSNCWRRKRGLVWLGHRWGLAAVRKPGSSCWRRKRGLVQFVCLPGGEKGTAGDVVAEWVEGRIVRHRAIRAVWGGVVGRIRVVAKAG